VLGLSVETDDEVGTPIVLGDVLGFSVNTDDEVKT